MCLRRNSALIAIKPALIVLVCAATSLVASAAPASLSVPVVGADGNDPRWRAVAEAVEFWNQQLADAGVGVRLGPIARLVQPVPDDALRQLSGLAVSGRFAGDIPQELERVQGEIVVALSTADLISFGLQWSPARKGLIGLRRADIPPMSLPNVLQNVVAHEVGHVLGLRPQQRSGHPDVRTSSAVPAPSFCIRHEPLLPADGGRSGGAASTMVRGEATFPTPVSFHVLYALEELQPMSRQTVRSRPFAQ